MRDKGNPWPPIPEMGDAHNPSLTGAIEEAVGNHENDQRLKGVVDQLLRSNGEKEPVPSNPFSLEFPPDALRESWVFENRMGEEGLSEAGRKALKERDETMLREKYKHPVTHLLNKTAMVEWMAHGIHEGITENIESLKKVARLSFDLNGLKLVNDLAGHDQGDLYLWAVAKVFEQSPLTEHLRQGTPADFPGRSFRIIPCAEGGDEFGLLLMSEHGPITTEEIKAIIKLYQEAVEAIRLNEIKDPHGNIRTIRIEQAIKNEREQRGKFRTIPEDFRYIPTIAGGGVRLDEALLHAIDAPDSHDSLKADDTFLTATNKLRRAMFTVADLQMMDNKRKMKELWLLSQNENKKHLVPLLQESGRP